MLRFCNDLSSVDAGVWDALHDGANPFVSHAFLTGLETTGCLRPRWGWTACHALLEDDGRLAAAAPGYAKRNSHGEFVFDHAWATAFERAGRSYYPKWLGAVPYSPVTGPRLLARHASDRARLAASLPAATANAGFGSAHVNFLRECECPSFGPTWLSRCDVQFHWRNAGWRDFQDFLEAMVHKRRKAIRQERARVAGAGIECRVVHGEDASAEDLAAMHAFYCLTFDEKGNSPALTLDFFHHLARTLPRSLLLILASRRGETIAGALCLRGSDTLYGRYWGAREPLPGLHFETCYYQGIEYCLREGLQRFEPGAQGEHKLARGFLPVLTHSRHSIPDPDFAPAIADWCAQERAHMAGYRDLLLQHTPFREPAPAPPGI